MTNNQTEETEGNAEGMWESSAADTPGEPGDLQGAQEMEDGHSGLVNYGNNCYANSVVQGWDM